MGSRRFLKPGFLGTLLALSFPRPAAAEEEKPVPHPLIVSKGGDEASTLVNAWFAEGKAAGLDGVFYDNRDRKHSDLGIANYPQLQPITYPEDELARRADWGGQRQIIPGKVVIGNSSTASSANQAGSHQRMYYTHPRGLDFLYQQYRTNALYIYPEHRDHDPGTNGPDGYGDLYPANSPYLISSQGSSGSDLVFMHAFLKTIAAFPPETREELIAEGLLMPTLQAIFRQTYKASTVPDDYFTGSAHPSAFEGNLIDELGMVKLANAMTPDAIPPLVNLRVTEEPELKPGRDYFEPSPFTAGEVLSNSPGAIARVIRGPAYRRTMRVSAADSSDFKSRKLKFRWAVLRGDPELIKIELAGEGSSEANISVAYHPRGPIAPGSEMWSNRVDLGVFAEAEGSIVSAPAFISFTTLPNEHRTYSDDGRLIEIFYGARSQSLGVPPADSDRWDSLLADLEDVPPEAQATGLKIVTALMTDDERAELIALAASMKPSLTQFTAANQKLIAITADQQKTVDDTNKVRLEAEKSHMNAATDATKSALKKADERHEAAKKALREGADGAAKLKAEVGKLRTEITSAIRIASAPEIVRAALATVQSNPEFFSANDSALRAAAEHSPNAKAPEALEAALRRLAFVSVSVTASANPAANESYHLAQLNAELLAEVLLPRFLNRPPAPNYADPRLTAPKLWRDVYRYADDGQCAGWTRYQDGAHSDFTAEGDLIVSRKTDGSPEQVVTVQYAINPDTKRLEATAAE